MATTFILPSAPRGMQKGVALKDILGVVAIAALVHNIQLVHPRFDGKSFTALAQHGLEPLGILQRGAHLAQALRQYLPPIFEDAIEILLASLTPANIATEGLGMAVFFYLPHVSFVAQYGLDPKNNQGRAPFELSMRAQYELTQRFSAEFSMRPFLIQQPERTLARLLEWATDSSAHVRRLCSEGARPRLPWATRIPQFIQDPTPLWPILNALKNDSSRYVQRSVANHLGDIAKDHPELVFALCEMWLADASSDVKWIIRHAFRHPAKKLNSRALAVRRAAK